MERRNISLLRKLTVFLFSIICLQIIFGVFVARMKAGFLYPTFPKMGDAWIPEEINTAFYEYGWSAFFRNGPTVHFIHRILSMIIFLFTVGLWIFTMMTELPFQVQLAIRVLIIVVVTQFFLGYLTLMNPEPVFLGILHLTGTFLLLGSALYLLKKLRTAGSKAA